MHTPLGLSLDRGVSQGITKRHYFLSAGVMKRIAPKRQYERNAATGCERQTPLRAGWDFV